MGAYFIYEHRIIHISHMKIWVHMSYIEIKFSKEWNWRNQPA